MKTKQGASTSLKPKTILLPGESLWELWELKSHPIKKSSVASPELLSKPPASIALPVNSIQTFPIWIHTSEVGLVHEMLQLQLEKRGLNKLCDYPSDQIPHWIINREPTKTLVVCSLLTNQLPENLKSSKIPIYESSHHIFTFTPQSITLWRELGKWVFAFVRDSQVVFTQSLQTTTLTTSAVQIIANTWLQLEAENAVGNLLHLMCWSYPQEEEVTLLEKHLGLHPQIQVKPNPHFPKNSFSFAPTELLTQQKATQKKGRLILLSILFLIAYGATLGSGGWSLFQRTQAMKQLESEVAALRPSFHQIRKTFFDWNSLQPALNPDRYPLELLMQVSSLLPKENARLTLFNITQNKLLIRGEAKSTEVALKLTTDLKNHPPFKGFQWEAPPPKILPNQTAQFQLEATFSYATP